MVRLQSPLQGGKMARAAPTASAWVLGVGAARAAPSSATSSTVARLVSSTQRTIRWPQRKPIAEDMKHRERPGCARAGGRRGPRRRSERGGSDRNMYGARRVRHAALMQYCSPVLLLARGGSAGLYCTAPTGSCTVQYSTSRRAVTADVVLG
ncbi:hypothetical protein CALCODRAFT_301230 [Calocera cornea HHB12733]|uniref:Uncharacterized protein n=1 Tax=Calocera cornea HHB12733 TaxID=1353952 RepID=A0A165FHX0_9BASI|nr:hypothetical protein CALCODRAFT_301230 [Calocera cornea HHB12733]